MYNLDLSQAELKAIVHVSKLFVLEKLDGNPEDLSGEEMLVLQGLSSVNERLMHQVQTRLDWIETGNG